MNEEFLKDNDYLKKNYEFLGSGLEGSVYKINEDLVLKKYNIPRNKNIKEISKILNTCKYNTFISPVSYLMKNDKVVGEFLPFFDGKDLTDIKKVLFDILIECANKFVQDIEKISLNGIVIQEGNFMINSSSIKMVDTTMFYKLYNFNFDELFIDNLRYFFDRLGMISPFLISYLKEYNNDLMVLYHDVENYGLFYKELKNTFENVTKSNVNTINEGIKKIKILQNKKYVL